MPVYNTSVCQRQNAGRKLKEITFFSFFFRLALGCVIGSPRVDRRHKPQAHLQVAFIGLPKEGNLACTHTCTLFWKCLCFVGICWQQWSQAGKRSEMLRVLKNLLSGTKKALFSSVGNRAKSLGVIGFEPTASCSQSRRSSQAELHPGNLNYFSLQGLRT